MFHNNEFSIALLETLFFKHFCFLTAVKTLFFHFVFLAYIFIFDLSLESIKEFISSYIVHLVDLPHHW